MPAKYPNPIEYKYPHEAKADEDKEDTSVVVREQAIGIAAGQSAEVQAAVQTDFSEEAHPNTPVQQRNSGLQTSLDDDVISGLDINDIIQELDEENNLADASPSQVTYADRVDGDDEDLENELEVEKEKLENELRWLRSLMQGDARQVHVGGQSPHYDMELIESVKNRPKTTPTSPLTVSERKAQISPAFPPPVSGRSDLISPVESTSSSSRHSSDSPTESEIHSPPSKPGLFHEWPVKSSRKLAIQHPGDPDLRRRQSI